MQELRIDKDIRPMSEVRKRMAAFIKQIHETKRPLVITQRGKSAAVLIGAQEYEAMREKIALLSDVQTALGQLEKGEGISHDDARDRLFDRLEK
jgi:antitoxin YefM